MEIIEYPGRFRWDEICARPALMQGEREAIVREIIREVRSGGDAALKALTLKYDGVKIDNLRVIEKEFSRACPLVCEELKEAIGIAAANIAKFHSLQGYADICTETSKGIICKRISRPVKRVGLYIPGGSAPLFSTLLMLGIPAKIAGCREITIFTPPRKDGGVSPEILYTAELIGLKDIVKAGGAQAVAAMAYGTESVRRVDKIYGPGNSFVTEAKLQVSRDVEIDMAAGPSELMVIADDSANCGFIAADLLSQAEHGPDSQLFLLTSSKEIALGVLEELTGQLNRLPRREIASKALANGKIVILEGIDEMTDFANLYGAEHLMLSVKDAGRIADKVENAGSIFLGNWSPESAGDYLSGTNHTLPTYGRTRACGGVILESFMHTVTIQEISREGLISAGGAVEVMAEAEGLAGHKNAVSVRLEQLKTLEKL
ncbi:MAG: histidinol dehydrogenase [Bacteroidales bacterium]|nr:histidinol dehydrogenase [Bacteroidales bacterium]MDD3990151.1 histidinol dehydrogenase [Bacteroidales bacterium]